MRNFQCIIFYMIWNIWADFQICISVPLKNFSVCSLPTGESILKLPDRLFLFVKTLFFIKIHLRVGLDNLQMIFTLTLIPLDASQ